ncbi:hypothetical protein [Streptomyces sp. ALI-76-A]|uniref:hypothetical protein n=1 Tax=Streptomyces sp. ALI-76-A TaxID=3025736 RepID=UPI00256ECC04|nr:hypothetical protein [Streptomyces sp. ALI-76-A]MDL5205296.1 hypothetical protein [Streptomyces sp. ALI-76-A]
MNAEKRLTRDELVEELRSALDADNGWLPDLVSSQGPVGVSKAAALDVVVGRLQEFAGVPAVPEAVARQLRNAADAADAALVTEGSAQYGALGAAYAYLVQARRAASE